MELRRLGRTGMKVSPLCLGGNVFGWTANVETSETVLDAYMDAGGNFIDTADSYSRFVPGNKGGESETILGEWMQKRGNRNDVVIASKCGSPYLGGKLESGLSRRYIMQAVELSLKRLQTDYIDLYQAHFDDPVTPVEETLRAYDDLVRQGKVRYLGASNFSAWRLTKALWKSDVMNLERYESLQPRYNLIDRNSYEKELEPLCRDQEIGVIPYSSIASGFLSGKYSREGDVPGTPRSTGVQRNYYNERAWGILDVVREVANEAGATPSQIALAWLLARPGITAPIASATSIDQLKELIGSTEVTLTDVQIERLTNAGK